MEQMNTMMKNTVTGLLVGKMMMVIVSVTVLVVTKVMNGMISLMKQITSTQLEDMIVMLIAQQMPKMMKT